MKFLFQSSIKQFYKLYSKFKWMFETFSTSQINSQYLMDYPQLFKYFKDIKSYLDLNWNSFKIVTMLHISWFSSRFFQFLVHFNLFLSNFTKTKNSVILLTASMHNKQFPFTFPPIKLQFAGYLRTIVYDQSSNIIVTHFELFFWYLTVRLLKQNQDFELCRYTGAQDTYILCRGPLLKSLTFGWMPIKIESYISPYHIGERRV